MVTLNRRDLASLLSLVVCVLVAGASDLASFAAPPEAGAHADYARRVRESEDLLHWVDARTGEVLWTDRDILRFDWERQLFELRRPKAIELALRRPWQGGLELYDADGLVYWCVLTSGASSVAYARPAVMQFKPGLPLLRIAASYPEGWPVEEDLRFDPRLREALDEAGVLAAVPEDDRPERVRVKGLGSVEPAGGPRMWLRFAPETLRGGRETWFALRVSSPEDLPEDAWGVRVTVRLKRIEGGYFTSDTVSLSKDMFRGRTCVFTMDLFRPGLERLAGPWPRPAELSATIALDVPGATEVEQWELSPTQVGILPPAGRDEADTPAARALTRRHEWDFRNVPLREAVESLRQVTELDYVLREEDVPPDGAPVTLVMETTLRNALDHICELTGMAWVLRDGAVVIGRPENLESYETRVYEVTDVLAHFGDATASPRTLGERTEELADLIRRLCGQGTWRGDGQEAGSPMGDERSERGSLGWLRHQPGRLVVQHTPEVHRCIEQILQSLRD
ncbi:MAG: hypothetical protein R6X33_06845 [Candidatus Brocadiia bacterium]